MVHQLTGVVCQVKKHISLEPSASSTSTIIPDRHLFSLPVQTLSHTGQYALPVSFPANRNSTRKVENAAWLSILSEEVVPPVNMKCVLCMEYKTHQLNDC